MHVVRDYPVIKLHNHTVDREMFAVKNFSPLAQVAKILRAKICLRRIIRVTLPAVAKIEHVEIYHAKKKESENFPIYGSIYLALLAISPKTLLRLSRTPCHIDISMMLSRL